VRQERDGLLQLRLAGDWIARTGLPAVTPIESAVANGNGPVKVMEFETADLGRWNSGLITFVLKCYELCQRNNIEFRRQTLPFGVAKLIELSQAVPEKKDAARHAVTPPFFQRIGESALAVQTGAVSMLTFVGENVLALLKLLRGKAQFRWSDTFWKSRRVARVRWDCGADQFHYGIDPCVLRGTQLKIRRLDLHG
jgi:phospholipid/cholesterol/gamma-HCH transport system permease protein